MEKRKSPERSSRRRVEPARKKTKTKGMPMRMYCADDDGLLSPDHPSNALNSHRPLTLQLLLIPLLVLLLAVLQARAAVRLQHPVLAAEMAIAEAAVADDPLRRVAAVFETTADLFGTSAADWQREVDRRLACDGVGGQSCARVGEVFAGVHEAEGGGGEVGAEREQGVEGGDGGGLGDC